MGSQVSSWRHKRSAAAPTPSAPAGFGADTFKVVMLGEAAVGKTALFSRLMGTALADAYVPSTAAGIGAKLLQLEGHAPVVVELWDVPPQSFAGPAIFARYLQGAQALVLVFSRQAPSSWRALPKYLAFVRRELLGESAEQEDGPLPLPAVVVGTKSDCVDAADAGEDAGMRAEARAWTRECGMAYVEVSTTNSSYLDVFKVLLDRAEV